jgi:integrase
MTSSRRPALTDRAMQSTPTGRDEWFSDGGARDGHGRLYGRLRASGERGFVLRYLDADGRRVNWPIGIYDPKATEPDDASEAWVLAQSALSLKLARRKASLLKALHAAGVRDLRGHFERERQIADAKQAAALARIDADAAAVRAATQAERERHEAAEAARRDAERYSLRALLDAYGRHLKRQGKASADDALRTFKLHVFEVADGPAGKPAKEVTPREFTALLRRLTEAGKGRTAAKLRAFMRAAYQLAFQADLNPDAPAELVPFGIESNPVAPTDPLSRYTVARERVLTEAELRLFMQQAALLPTAQADAIRLALLLGGQRPAQLLRATRDDVDADAGTLALRDPKGRRAQPRLHVLPLVGEARGIVDRLVDKASVLGVPWLFTSIDVEPGTVRAIVGPTLESPDAVVVVNGIVPMRQETVSSAAAAISAGLVAAKKVRSPFQMRDIRRTCETMLAAMGVDREIRAQLLSHGISGVQAKHYDRHGYLREKQQTLARWEVRLGRITRGEKEPKVTSLTDARARMKAAGG